MYIFIISTLCFKQNKTLSVQNANTAHAPDFQGNHDRVLCIIIIHKIMSITIYN